MADLSLDWRRLFEQRTPEAARALVGDDDAGAFAAWEAARAVLAQSEARVASRTAELEVLQSLGRRCAEAVRPRTLFGTAAQVLQERAGFDLFVAALTGDRPRLRAWIARPCAPACLDRAAAAAWEAMDSGLPQPPLGAELLL